MFLLFLSSSKRKYFVSGSQAKHVTCEGCQSDYTYIITREAEGEDRSLFSWDDRDAFRKAQANAEQNLERALAEGQEAVGCPECGWVQTHMIEHVRRRSYKGLRGFAIAGFLFASVAIVMIGGFGVVPLLINADHRPNAGEAIFGATAVLASLVGLFGIPATLFWLLRSWLNTRYDPNREFVHQDALRA